ncbi:hypothetical protein P692DRAFT_20737324, partial [Suillus brevipes Sb2]
QQDLAKRCLEVVQDFRAAKGTKFEAAYIISTIINESLPSNSGEDPTAFVAIYLTMLDQCESEQSQAARRATGAARERRSDIRSRRASIEADEPKKRVKLDFSCLDLKPTVHQEPARPLSANLRHTIRIIQNWAQDQKQAKLKLMYHERSPEFHESRWADIVAGRCINLDAIHTIITTSRSVDKHTEFIGEVELTYGVSETATKKITTQGQWNAAWNKAARALKFAFPFRQAELDAYSEQINEQFDQQLEGSHGRVLRYDKAVRSRVGNSRRYELSDFECFKDIYSLHFSAGGRLHNDTGDSSKSTGGRDSSAKREPCRKWNTGECTRSAATCRFAHVCNVEQDGRVCARRHVKAKHNEDVKTKST